MDEDKDVLLSFVIILVLLFRSFPVVLDISVNAKMFNSLLSIFVNDKIDVKKIRIEKSIGR
jgi:hypothetical protein